MLCNALSEKKFWIQSRDFYEKLAWCGGNANSRNWWYNNYTYLE
jgi:hypothetical protein